MISQIFLSDVLTDVLNLLLKGRIHLGPGSCNAHRLIVS